MTKIPSGSLNIDIRQFGYGHSKDDDNYLGKYQPVIDIRVRVGDVLREKIANVIRLGQNNIRSCYLT